MKGDGLSRAGLSGELASPVAEGPSRELAEFAAELGYALVAGFPPRAVRGLFEAHERDASGVSHLAPEAWQSEGGAPAGGAALAAGLAGPAASDPPRRLCFDLDLEGLGALRVVVEHGQSGVLVTIQVPDEATLSLVSREGPLLRRQLEARGLVVRGLELGLAGTELAREDSATVANPRVNSGTSVWRPAAPAQSSLKLLG